MRRSKVEFLSTSLHLRKKRLLRFLLILGAVYLAFLLICELPYVSFLASSAAGSGSLVSGARRVALGSEEDTLVRLAPVRPFVLPYRLLPSSPSSAPSPDRQRRNRDLSAFLSGLVFSDFNASADVNGAFSELHKSAKEAWEVGLSLFEELKGVNSTAEDDSTAGEENGTQEICPRSITMTGAELQERGRVVVLPCGLTLGSHITLVARPQPAHMEYDPKISISNDGSGAVMVSQFMVELQGLKTVDGEDPPRIFHFNPRLKGDWSEKPVIEQNTCYRQQWGPPQRCEGWKSKADEETVDGLLKCEKWIRNDGSGSEESKMAWWLSRLIGRTKKVSLDWPYPFTESKLFVLTVRAGLEGYHVNVDGRHVTSFPYRTGFTLEDATGLSLNGNLEVQSIFAASLPASHPSFAPQKHLEMSAQWQAPPLPDEPVELFIGILSAGNHFAERMAVRKSWLSAVRKSSNVVARFFVALHGRKEVNSDLKKEAEFFGDIVIVPYLDNYDLVVLKTLAICEYGVRVISAKYVMKCDDDTFVRLDSVLKEVRKIPTGRSLYVGNMNYYHQPLRSGKWAVTYEEWPEEDYPPYANGPGYVVSSDIANYIVSEFEKHELRLFKMEDVSMGMWVENFNISKPVEYVHSVNFCQFGCIDGYYTAHYQSPRQMLCMWNKLKAGKAQCCNLR